MKIKLILPTLLLLLSCTAPPVAADNLPIRVSIAKYKLIYLLNSGEGTTVLQRMRMQAFAENLETARLAYFEGDYTANKVKDMLSNANNFINQFTNKNTWRVTVPPSDDRWMK